MDVSTQWICPANEANQLWAEQEYCVTFSKTPSITNSMYKDFSCKAEKCRDIRAVEGVVSALQPTKMIVGSVHGIEIENACQNYILEEFSIFKYSNINKINDVT